MPSFLLSEYGQWPRQGPFNEHGDPGGAASQMSYHVARSTHNPPWSVGACNVKGGETAVRVLVWLHGKTLS